MKTCRVIVWLTVMLAGLPMVHAQEPPAEKDDPPALPQVVPGKVRPPLHVAVWPLKELSLVKEMGWARPLVQRCLVLGGNRVAGLSMTAEHVVKPYALKLEYEQMGPGDAEKIRRVGRDLAVDRMVFGHVTVTADNVEVMLRVVDVRSGLVLHSGAAKVKRDAPHDLLVKALGILVESCNHRAHAEGRKVEPMPKDRRIELDDEALAGAMSVISKDPEALEHFAEATSTANDFLSARALKKALEKDDTFAAALVLHAVELARMRDYKEALALFNRAAGAAPDWHRVYDNRGYLLLGGGHPDRAVEDFTRGLAAKPDYAPLWNNRATLQLRGGKLAEALADFTEAARLNPNQYLYRNNRAATLYKLGKVDEAVVDYTAALEIKPDFLRARYNRAIARMAAGDNAKAMEDVREIRRQGGKITEAFVEQMKRARARGDKSSGDDRPDAGQ